MILYRKYTPPVHASQTHNLSSQMIVGYVIHNGGSFRFHVIIMTSLEEIHTHTLHCNATPAYYTLMRPQLDASRTNSRSFSFSPKLNNASYTTDQLNPITYSWIVRMAVIGRRQRRASAAACSIHCRLRRSISSNPAEFRGTTAPRSNKHSNKETALCRIAMVNADWPPCHEQRVAERWLYMNDVTSLT